MDFNYLKKRVAVLSAVALATAGMTATVMPAAAAEGDIVIGPKSGSGNTVFATDDFELRAAVKAQLDTSQFAFRIDNPDQNQLAIVTDEDVSAFGIKADGSLSDGGELAKTGDTVDADGPALRVDFAELDIVSLVIYGTTPTSGIEDLTIQLDNGTVSNAVTNAIHPFEHGELTSATSVTVTAWLETTNAPDEDDYASVDTEYSSSFEVNFVDPSDVSAIPQIERVNGYSTTYDFGNEDVVSADVAIRGNINVSSTSAYNRTDTVDDYELKENDLVLVFDQTSAAENGLYQVGSAADSAMSLVDTGLLGLVFVENGTKYGGQVFSALGNQEIVNIRAENASNTTISSGVDSGASFDGLTLDSDDYVLLGANQGAANERGIYGADTATATEVDVDVNEPIFINGGTKSGTLYYAADSVFSTTQALNADVDALNQASDKFMGGSLRFSNSNVNLAQVDLSNWEINVKGDGSGATGFMPGAITENLTATGSGLKIDTRGRVFMTLPIADGSADAGATYTWSIRHKGATTVEYNSNGFQVIEAPAASLANDVIDVSVGTSTDASIGTYSSGFPVSVRQGTESLTFTAQLESSDGTTARGANIPVLAVVTAGDNWIKGETLTVSGSTETVSLAESAVVVSGLTDADGQFDLTVTSSDASSASAVYKVEFFALKDNDAWDANHQGTGDAIFNVDYASPALATTDAFTASTTVASGSEITLSFDVVDQFGQPLSATATGKAYSVELQASNDDDLDLDAVVADGTATFTFDNYVTAGGSDVLTAKLYTGTSTSPAFVSGQTTNVTLYNTNAIVGINLTNDEFTGKTVEYTDFFAGKAAAGQKEPSTSNNYTVQGTVVDSKGAGVPGAPVTISAEGMAFKADGSTTYAVDSIDVIASAAGAFKVDFWTQTYSEDGVELTVTSGDQTATATVEAGLPDPQNRGNLRMSWTIDADSQFVMNTTYAVTATVEDVFGNPVKGAFVKYTGLAAAEFNGGTAATRVTGGDGTAVAYLRSIKDVSGLSAVGLELLDSGINYDTSSLGATIKDNTKTSWDESEFSNSLSQEINFLASAPDVTTNQKVNAGSFKGYVAVYALGYEGQRLSAKIGKDWVIVDPIVNNQSANLARVTDFTGAGVDIQVRIYIDRVLVDTIPLTTK